MILHPHRFGTSVDGTGLLSWWKLDEISGTRLDAHGGYALSDVNTVGSVVDGGRRVAYFNDAAQEYFARSSPIISNVVSVTAWINLEDRTFYGGPASIGVLQDLDFFPQGYQFFMDTAGRLSFYASFGAGGTRTSSYVVPLNTWVHVACAVGASNMQLYANGTQVLSASTPSGFGPRNSFKVGSQMDGMMRDVSLWTRQLAADEVATLMDGGYAAVE